MNERSDYNAFIERLKKSDDEFRQAFNAALAKVMANPGKMLERAGKYGYDKAQLPPPDMTTEWACSTK